MAEIYEWPTNLLPSKCNLRLKSNKKQFTSPFNGSTQEVFYPGSRWMMDLTFDNLDDYEARELETILYQMDNGGAVKVPDFGRFGTNQTGIKVFSGGQTGNVLITSGWAPNQLDCVRKGEYFEVGGELKFILKTTSSDSAGRCAIEFAPMLRNSPQSGDPVEFQRPCGYFRLDQDENGPNRMPAFSNSFSVSLVETFYPGLVPQSRTQSTQDTETNMQLGDSQ